ncbi:hypothetical protein N7478_010465 [Penicillium angulare]|uniref:uncharacterized protein n=1 Tax=Penicillium angulare TaxID=116970 RepID=UPI002541BFD9|nr:uncharacterized protein N7478_010465 [Penicillium angulare]KAJ5267657.1 hypothetical protein N7478_010465 [Penicillium angulare]
MAPISDDNPKHGDEGAVSPSKRRFSATESLDRLQTTHPVITPEPPTLDICSIPATSAQRCQASNLTTSRDQDVCLPEKIALQEDAGQGLPETYGEETVLYLAYGSNMAAQTFLGMRGIKPISKIPALIPELYLTFDLPGLPYAEPCFAGTNYRDPDSLPDQSSESEYDTEEDMSLVTESEFLSEKAPLVQSKALRSSESQQKWNKPLIGVVYEVTLKDYAKIIATEGGGRGYRDVVVDCFPFAEDYTSTNPVPYHPSTQPFKAHTLLSPAADDARKRTQAAKTGESSVSSTRSCAISSTFGDVGVHMRPDPEYAQPSARYLGLLIKGTEEHDLPVSYREYLSHVRPYEVTTTRQKIGKWIFLISWGPAILMTLQISKRFAGPDGRSPPWVISSANLLFAGMWNSYDYIFKRVFGDGERTIGDIQAM